MGAELFLSVLSPERRLVEGVRVASVVLPGSEGQIEVLPGHAAFIGTLQAGFFRYRLSSDQTVVGVLSGGFLHVIDHHVYVLAQTLELGDEIDLDRAKKAQAKAAKNLENEGLNDREFKRFQLKLQRALIRQQLATGKHPFL